jgi:hypothetical protein
MAWWRDVCVTLTLFSSSFASAGYVAGQLVYAMSQPHFTTALLGFNPGTSSPHTITCWCWSAELTINLATSNQ